MTTILGPTQRLRFLGGGDVTVSAANNSILNSIDITINLPPSGGVSVANYISLYADWNLRSPLSGHIGVWAPLSHIEPTAPQFVTVVDWGDGSPMEHISVSETEDADFYYLVSPSSGTRTIKLYCSEWSRVGYLDLGSSWNQGFLINPFPWEFITNLTNLQSFNIWDQEYSGPIPVNTFSGLTNLEYVSLACNAFTGTIPNMSTCTKLNTFNAYSLDTYGINFFTNTIAGSFANSLHLVNLDISGNSLTEMAIDQILLDLVNSLSLPDRHHCYVYLNGGTNSPPSSTGLGYKQILVNTDGWTVITN